MKRTREGTLVALYERWQDMGLDDYVNKKECQALFDLIRELESIDDIELRAERMLDLVPVGKYDNEYGKYAKILLVGV